MPREWKEVFDGISRVPLDEAAGILLLGEKFPSIQTSLTSAEGIRVARLLRLAAQVGHEYFGF